MMGATFVNPMAAYQAAQRKVSPTFNRPLAIQQLFKPVPITRKPAPPSIFPVLKPSVPVVSPVPKPSLLVTPTVTPTVAPVTSAVPALVSAATSAGAPSAAGTDLTELDATGSPTSPDATDGASTAMGSVLLLGAVAFGLYFILNRKSRR